MSEEGKKIATVKNKTWQEYSWAWLLQQNCADPFTHTSLC